MFLDKDIGDDISCEAKLAKDGPPKYRAIFHNLGGIAKGSKYIFEHVGIAEKALRFQITQTRAEYTQLKKLGCKEADELQKLLTELEMNLTCDGAQNYFQEKNDVLKRISK